MKRIFVFIAAALAAVFACVGLWAGVASAHQANITGETTCLDEGAWTVRWTVGNSETDTTMTVDSASVNGASIALSPNPVPGSGFATGTSAHGSQSASATLSVNAHWSNGVTHSDQATVNKPEDCVVPTTTTTTEATTTTTEATTTTTEATTTTTVVAVTTTVQVDATTVVTQPVAVTPAPQVEAAEVSNSLPVTGAVSLPLIISGASLLLVGVGLVVVARRRGVAV